MSDNKDSLNWKFYALFGAATMGVISGIYYIYTLFNDNGDADLSDEQKEKLEELIKINETNQNQTEETPGRKKESDSSFAIRIFKQINELSEEMFTKDYPNWIQIRRNLLKENNKPEYNSYCENILSEKMRIESKAAEMILNKLGMSQLELQSMMEKIPQSEFMLLQQEMVQKSQLNSSIKNPEKLTDNEVIKAFKEFLKLKNEMDNESRNMAQFMNDPSEEARMMFFIKLEINKYMIDDYLSNLFEIDFSALMMMINTRQLFSNPEIASDYQRLIQEFNQAQY